MPRDDGASFVRLFQSTATFSRLFSFAFNAAARLLLSGALPAYGTMFVTVVVVDVCHRGAKKIIFPVGAQQQQYHKTYFSAISAKFYSVALNHFVGGSREVEA